MKPKPVMRVLGNKHMNEEPHEPPNFWGKPGEPVSVVDPEDLKTVWQIGADFQASHPGQTVGVDSDLYKQACKPGADIQAVAYRNMWLSSMLGEFMPAEIKQ